MTVEQRKRAGEAVAARIVYLNTTMTDVARGAGVNPSTVRRLVHGQRWPREDTRERINEALDWPQGELDRYRIGQPHSDLSGISTRALVAELCHRYTGRHLGRHSVPKP